MKLEDYSTDDLKYELYKREQKENAPKMLDNPDFSEVKKLAQEIVNNIVDGSDHVDRKIYTYYIFENTMMAYFGKDFFNWYNKNI